MNIRSKQICSKGLTRRNLLKFGLYSGLTAGLWLSGCGTNHGRKRPNIILITVDTLRADHLGCYGYSRNTSPNIDRFAQHAMLFENCFSHAPSTHPSVASMLSGFLPHETKIWDNSFLSSEVITLPEILLQMGYKTVAVVSNYVLRKTQGFEQGFLVYDDTMDEHELVRRNPERTAEPTTARAIELLTQFRNSQLFMWIHYQDPHGPYTPPDDFAKPFFSPKLKPSHIKVNSSLSGIGGIPAYQRMGSNNNFHYYVSQYDGEIRYQDEHFKHLVNALKEMGLYDSALIIFSSDHGESMGEHNHFFCHGENLYSEQTRVPLILKYGNKLSGRRKDFVQHMDILPTILNIIGAKPDPRYRGRDLLRPHDRGREFVMEMKSPLDRNNIKYSIVLDKLKLIYTPVYQQYELFDLNSDFSEEQNLILVPRYQEQFKALQKRLKRIIKEDFPQIPIASKPREFSLDEIEKLRSLGYTQ